MAYIHKETFDIIQESNIDGFLDDYFEVDDLIALPIQILNRKGYRTRFCCAGHPFDELSETFYPVEIAAEQSPICGTFKVEKVDAKQDDEYPYRILYRQANDRSSYIVFEKGIKLPHLPKDFGIDEKDEDDDFPIKAIALDDDGNEIPSPLEGTSTLATYYEEELPIYEFYAEVLEAMTCLHDWALALPEHELQVTTD